VHHATTGNATVCTTLTLVSLVFISLITSYLLTGQSAFKVSSIAVSALTLYLILYSRETIYAHARKPDQEFSTFDHTWYLIS
jgi:hypothetical protein